jgi:hypothetical protein
MISFWPKRNFNCVNNIKTINVARKRRSCTARYHIARNRRRAKVGVSSQPYLCTDAKDQSVFSGLKIENHLTFFRSRQYLQLRLLSFTSSIIIQLGLFLGIRSLN